MNAVAEVLDQSEAVGALFNLIKSLEAAGIPVHTQRERWFCGPDEEAVDYFAVRMAALELCGIRYRRVSDRTRFGFEIVNEPASFCYLKNRDHIATAAPRGSDGDYAIGPALARDGSGRWDRLFPPPEIGTASCRDRE